VAADAALASAQAHHGPAVAYWFEWLVVVTAGYGLVLGITLWIAVILFVGRLTERADRMRRFVTRRSLS
jgi:hypothetical protein